MTAPPYTSTDSVAEVYATLDERIDTARTSLGRPLTLAEKIPLQPSTTEARPAAWMLSRNAAATYTDLRPDRVALQDATAQMAWLQFMTAELDRVQVPVTTHCDHLVQARSDAKKDLLAAPVGERRGVRLSCAASAPATAPGSGNPAAGSSTR